MTRKTNTHFLEWLKINRQTMLSLGNEMEDKELSCSAGRNAE